ncbi:MAG TPA: hypothetical protein VG649_10945 [Candidatus Angelobacter sp.]|nr:hypothetical protein [Candidatus Angelobacter sp.]
MIRFDLEYIVRQSTFPLRLPISLQAEARKTADQQGVSLNQLFSLAIAEKISALRTEEFFRTRAKGANVTRARMILKRAGKEPVREGDEILSRKKRKKPSKRM